MKNEESRERAKHPAADAEQTGPERESHFCADACAVLLPTSQSHHGNLAQLASDSEERTNGTEQCIKHVNCTCGHYSQEENSMHFSSQRDKEKGTSVCCAVSQWP